MNNYIYLRYDSLIAYNASINISLQIQSCYWTISLDLYDLSKWSDWGGELNDVNNKLQKRN